MKVSLLLPLAAAIAVSAFVIPDDQTQNVLAQVDTPFKLSEKPSTALILAPKPCHKKSNAKNGIRKHGKGVYVDRENMEAFHGRGWLKSPSYQALDLSEEEVLGYHHYRPDDEEENGDRPPPPPHGRPPHHRHEPNETIWQIISTSKYTTKLAKVIGEYDDLVELLNGTSSNYTLFAPTDHAFEKLEHHHGNHSDHKPSKELIKKVLTYHVSPEFYPAGKVLTGHTIPSSLLSDKLGGPQRLRVGLGFRGLAVNFYSRIVAVDIFATNGVIHGVDSIILPPPPIGKIITLLPGTFSTFTLASSITNLTDHIPHAHVGATLFAPSNSAFQRLGPRLNAFLFSPYGRKYLLALLKYHIVYNETLYSDAYYHPDIEEGTKGIERATGIPKGRYHVDLSTLLDGKYLSIDISRFGGLIDITINGYVKVAVQDGVAADGVIQVVNNVLVPPKKPGEGFDILEDMTVEQFKARFAGIVEKDEVDSEMYREEEFITLW